MAIYVSREIVLELHFKPRSMTILPPRATSFSLSLSWTDLHSPLQHKAPNLHCLARTTAVVPSRSTFRGGTSGPPCGRISWSRIGACGCSRCCTCPSCRRCSWGSTCHTCLKCLLLLLNFTDYWLQQPGFLNRRWHFSAELTQQSGDRSRSCLVILGSHLFCIVISYLVGVKLGVTLHDCHCNLQEKQRKHPIPVVTQNTSRFDPWHPTGIRTPIISEGRLRGVM